jgi:hypothetical protein
LEGLLLFNLRTSVTIKNVTVRAPSKKHNKCKRNHYHGKYLELKGRLLKEKQSVKILCEQKLKMASVREAVDVP